MIRAKGLYFVGGFFYILLSVYFLSVTWAYGAVLKADVDDQIEELDNMEIVEDQNYTEYSPELTDEVNYLYSVEDPEEDPAEDPTEERSESEDENGEDMNNNNLGYMLIFALGTIAGVMTGSIIFGWLR